MKKVLLLSLGLVMGFSAFAQKHVAKADLRSSKVSVKQNVYGTDVVNSAATYSPKTGQSVVVNRSEILEQSETMMTTFDLQSNGFVSNRMYQLPNGSVAVTATISSEYNQSASDRGTGYNFYSNGSWNDMPSAREEANATGADMRTGWPSIAPFGANGEILVNHASGLNFWTRETAGEGQWDGPHSIPNPTGLEGQQYAYAMSWPRVVTSGANNEIIHVFAAAQYSIDANTNSNAQFYCRSTDGGQTWDVNWSPLFNDDEHIDVYSADDYAVSANGDAVVVAYSGSLSHHVVIYKSEDNGQTWERRIVWENPYYGLDWEDEASVYTDTMYGPAHVSVALDQNAVAHVALSSYMYTHDAVGTTYTVWRGLSSDGIAYWNSESETPIQAVNDNPHDALRLWFPLDGDYIGHVIDDSVRFCGWIAPNKVAGTYWNEFTGDALYMENDYFYAMYGTSSYPSIAVDPEGNLAMAYSTPDLTRLDGNGFYLRTVCVSYKKAGEDKWSVAEDNLFTLGEDAFIHMYDEGVAVNAVSTPVNVNEFWFSCQADDLLGLYWGNEAQQSSASDNIIYAFKVCGEGMDINETIAKDVVYNVYPNPASDYIFVSSSMDADATVTFTNLAGQTVKVVNTNLTTGDNSVSINDLNSGVYFCTVTANGYSHTTKVVVK